jgi:hypothetical protein
MSPQRIEEIKHQIVTNSLNREQYKAVVQELLTYCESVWAIGDQAEAAPGELFRRAHVMLQASAEFQMFSAAALLSSYAKALKHTPNVEEMITRLRADLASGADRAEVVSRELQGDWTERDHIFMRGRKVVKNLLRVANAALEFVRVVEETAKP